MRRRIELCITTLAMLALGQDAVALPNGSDCVGSAYPCEGFLQETCENTAGKRIKYISLGACSFALQILSSNAAGCVRYQPMQRQEPNSSTVTIPAMYARALQAASGRSISLLKCGMSLVISPFAKLFQVYHRQCAATTQPQTRMPVNRAVAVVSLEALARTAAMLPLTC